MKIETLSTFDLCSWGLVNSSPRRGLRYVLFPLILVSERQTSRPLQSKLGMTSQQAMEQLFDTSEWKSIQIPHSQVH